MAARKKPSLAAQLAAERKARRDEEELTSQMARALSDERDARFEEARERAVAEREARVEGARSEFARHDLGEQERRRRAGARTATAARTTRAAERRDEVRAEVLRLKSKMPNLTPRGIEMRVRRWYREDLDKRLKDGVITQDEFIALSKPRKRPGRKLIAAILKESGADRAVRATRL